MNIEFKNKTKQQSKAYDISTALDNIWNMDWLQQSITKKDMGEIPLLNDEISEIPNYERIIILSEPETSDFIKSMLYLFPSSKKSKFIVFTANLSTQNYVELFESIENKKVLFLPVAVADESVSYKCAYATIKKYLSDNRAKHGGFNILNVYGEKSSFIREDTEENDFDKIKLNLDNSDFLSANSTLAIFLMLISGSNADEYLKGFYNAVSSPLWDTTAANLAISLIDDVTSGAYIHSIGIKTSQRELYHTCKWVSLVLSGIFNNNMHIYTQMTDNADLVSKESGKNELHLFISSNASHKDIVTPFFPGCHEDGSMDMLREENIKKLYDDSSDYTKCVSVSDLKEENAGQLMAYLQLTLNLVKELYNNALQ